MNVGRERYKRYAASHVGPSEIRKFTSTDHTRPLPGPGPVFKTSADTRCFHNAFPRIRRARRRRIHTQPRIIDFIYSRRLFYVQQQPLHPLRRIMVRTCDDFFKT